MDRPKPHALRGVTKVLERDVERPCVAHWRRMGLIHKKNNGPGNRSWPDDVFINIDGLHCYIEFKAPGKLPTPDQVRQINRLRNSGCHVYIIDNVEHGKTLLNLFSNSEKYIAAINMGVDMFNAQFATKQ